MTYSLDPVPAASSIWCPGPGTVWESQNLHSKNEIKCIRRGIKVVATCLDIFMYETVGSLSTLTINHCSMFLAIFLPVINVTHWLSVSERHYVCTTFMCFRRTNIWTILIASINILLTSKVKRAPTSFHQRPRWPRNWRLVLENRVLGFVNFVAFT